MEIAFKPKISKEIYELEDKDYVLVKAILGLTQAINRQTGVRT